MQLFDPILLLESGFFPNTCSAVYEDHGHRISFCIYAESRDCVYQQTITERQFSDQSHLEWIVQQVREKLVVL